MTAGEALAEQLCEAISPYEDVRGYLHQTVLPNLGLAIEDLLHQVHASGELQRVLRKEPEERSAVRPPREKRHEEPEDSMEVRRQNTGGSRKPSLNGGSASASLSTSSLNDGTGSTNVRDGTMSAPPVIRRYSNSSDAQVPPPPILESPEEAKFDPLVWLSERLKQSTSAEAAPLSAEARSKIKERVVLQIKAAEAAEEAERQRLAEAEALRAEEGEMATIAETPRES
ncbi:unnamed protein product [Durusdinium trenchii]